MFQHIEQTQIIVPSSDFAGTHLGLVCDNYLHLHHIVNTCVNLFQNRPIGLKDMEWIQNIVPISNLSRAHLTFLVQVQTWVLHAAQQLNMVQICLKSWKNCLAVSKIITWKWEINICKTIFERGYITTSLTSLINSLSDFSLLPAHISLTPSCISSCASCYGRYRYLCLIFILKYHMLTYSHLNMLTVCFVKSN